MWDTMPHRLALLELVTCGTLRRRDSQEAAWEELLQLGWARRSGRRGVISLEDGESVRRVLDRAWPEWHDALGRLERLGLSPDERGWKELQRRERARDVGSLALPERLNRRTATAMVASHSKSSLTETHRSTLEGVEIVTDGLVRLRPSPGLVVQRGACVLDAATLAGVLGEVVLTERALADGTVLAGAWPRAVLSVENRGPYLDLQPPEGWLVLHAPGWDTVAARAVAEMLGEVPWVHFGDLDPQGVLIARHLRVTRPDLHWFVPAWWEEYVPRHGRPASWPDDLLTEDDPVLAHAPGQSQPHAGAGAHRPRRAPRGGPRGIAGLTRTACERGRERDEPLHPARERNPGNFLADGPNFPASSRLLTIPSKREREQANEVPAHRRRHPWPSWSSSPPARWSLRLLSAPRPPPPSAQTTTGPATKDTTAAHHEHTANERPQAGGARVAHDDTTRVSTCYNCSGSGDCWTCSGSGKASGASCYICSGTGKCYYCGGKGTR